MPSPGWPAALKGKVTVDERAGRLGAPAPCSGYPLFPSWDPRTPPGCGTQALCPGWVSELPEGKGESPCSPAGRPCWKGLSRPARPSGRGVRPSVGFLRPQPPFPLRQEPPWFPRSRVPSLAWPAAVSHSAEGGWGFPFLGGRASAGTPPQGQSGPGPPRHPSGADSWPCPVSITPLSLPRAQLWAQARAVPRCVRDL